MLTISLFPVLLCFYLSVCTVSVTPCGVTITHKLLTVTFLPAARSLAVWLYGNSFKEWCLLLYLYSGLTLSVAVAYRRHWKWHSASCRPKLLLTLSEPSPAQASKPILRMRPHEAERSQAPANPGADHRCTSEPSRACKLIQLGSAQAANLQNSKLTYNCCFKPQKVMRQKLMNISVQFFFINLHNYASYLEVIFQGPVLQLS